MALPKSSEIISRATTNFNNIKDALEFVGVDTSNITSDTYNEEIKALKDKMGDVSEYVEQIEELEAQNTELINTNASLTEQNNNLTNSNLELNNKVTEDNSNFSDIYDAIVEKGQTPTESDRSTYAGAILAIESGGGSTEDYEIRNCYQLFGFGTSTTDNYRSNVIDALLPHCKNVINWNSAFYGAKIENGKTVEIDMTKVTNQDNTWAFFEAMPKTYSAEITLKAKTNAVFRYLFTECNNTNKYGFINAVIDDISDGTNITTLSDLFKSAKGIKSISINAVLNNVKYLNNTFQDMNSSLKSGMLQVLDMSNWGIDWTKIEQLKNMCQGSKYLTEIKLASEAPVLTDANPYMAFNGCSYLTKIGIGFKDTSSKSDYMIYSDLFNGCSKLEEVYSTEDWIIRAPIYKMFYGCSKLTKLPTIHLDNWTLCNNTTYSYQSAFYGCSALEEITIYLDQEPSTTGYSIGIAQFFYNCSKLKAIKGAFNMNNISQYSSMIFYKCGALETIETNGCICNITTANYTFDISASPVFNISKFINDLVANTTGKTRTIKLHADVYNALTDETIALATTKNYTLASA
jgi:hypothetical protein